MTYPDHSKNIIEIKNMSFSYFKDYPVLKDISLNIHYGDYLGIIGPNGGGKSTLIKLILGLLKPDAGTIKVFANSVGYVAQKTNDIDSRFPVTVYDVVSMGRFPQKGLFKSLNKTDREIIDKALAQVKMANFKNRLIGNLSGGQEQKVYIARALAQESQIIFLDEPTSGVDEASRHDFYQLLKKLNQDLGITLVLISHDIDMITREVTEVAIVDGGITYYNGKSIPVRFHH
jgi:zinc transport system ATP-binding protein